MAVPSAMFPESLPILKMGYGFQIIEESFTFARLSLANCASAKWISRASVCWMDWPQNLGGHSPRRRPCKQQTGAFGSPQQQGSLGSTPSWLYGTRYHRQC